MTGKATDTAKVEQRNRELHNRCEKLLAEKTKESDSLQKSLSKTKKENAELQRKVAELEAKVAEVKPEDAPVDAAESVEEKESAAA